MKKLVKSSERKNKDIVSIFTDGSCRKTKEGARAGYGIHFVDLDIPDIGKKFKLEPITNQRAELYAIYKGIKTIRKFYTFNKLIIYTDSAYSIGCLTKWISGWKQTDWKTSTNKPVLNQDIIKKIDKYLVKYKNKIVFEHVKAHTGKTDFKSIGNHKADLLANLGSEF